MRFIFDIHHHLLRNSVLLENCFDYIAISNELKLFPFMNFELKFHPKSEKRAEVEKVAHCFAACIENCLIQHFLSHLPGQFLLLPLGRDGVRNHHRRRRHRFFATAMVGVFYWFHLFLSIPGNSSMQFFRCIIIRAVRLHIIFPSPFTNFQMLSADLRWFHSYAYQMCMWIWLHFNKQNVVSFVNRFRFVQIEIDHRYRREWMGNEMAREAIMLTIKDVSYFSSFLESQFVLTAGQAYPS